MKRCLALFLIVLAVLMSAITCVAAKDENDPAEIVYLEDGSYIVISEVRVVEGKDIRSATKYKIGNRDVTNYDADGNVLWKFTLTANFMYEEGVYVVCNNVSYARYIEDDAWSFSGGYAYTSANNGIGGGTFNRIGISYSACKDNRK